MSNIVEIKNVAVSFLKENVECYDITVVKLERVNQMWNAIAEVYEDDSFLKSMNLPPKKRRTFYSILLDDNKEVCSFERMDIGV